MFLDWKNDDFGLKPNSPAYKLSFEAIPEKIGVRAEQRGMSFLACAHLSYPTIQRQTTAF